MQENDEVYGKCYRYYPRRRSVRKFYFGRIAAAVCILCFVTCILIFVFAPRQAARIVIKSEKYYLVQTLACEYSSLASDEAYKLRQLGGAGYILNDGTFHVVAAVYTSETDAAAAVKRLESSGISSSVFELSTQEVKLAGTQDESIKKTVKECGLCPKKTVSRIVELSEEYDLAEISDSLAMLEIEKERNKLRRKFEETLGTDYETNPFLSLLYSRLDNAFVRFSQNVSTVGVRSAIKELACTVAAEHVAATRSAA